MWATIFILLIGALTSFYAWSKKKMRYFRDAGVPEDPGSFPFGSKPNKDVMTQKIPFIRMTEEIYEKYPDKPFVGLYGMFGTSPNLVINDLELAKRVLIKDFDHFVDRRSLDMAPEANKYLMNMLTQLTGDKWKAMRSTISPVFTSGKLRSFVPQIEKCADDLMEYLEKVESEGKEIDAKELMTNYNLDVICTTGFGIKANCFSNSEDSKLIQMVHRIARTGKYKETGLKATFSILKMMICFFFPTIGRLFNIPLIDKEAEKFLVNIIKSRLEDSKKGTENSTPSFLNVFVKALEANEIQINSTSEDTVEKKLDQFEEDAKIMRPKSHQSLYSNQEEYETVIISNLFLLFFAGFDTQSTVLSLVLHYLATNQEAQERLYQDILDAVDENDGSHNIDYNKLQDMWYMEAFINECLRMYALSPLERQTTKPYKLSHGNVAFTVPKGMIVTVPVGFMKDEKYFKNPNKFDPENFSPENKAARGPYVFTGFGQGPRNCIGMRFAYLNLKIAMFRILIDYKIVPCSKTVDELIPDPTSTNGSPLGGTWIKVEKRK